ncbi:hypothetical protein PoB_006548200 [Plakobranchus ocellatus]|uniref:Uncharacterized protein n=1 Tax=Plakobranchus ocellatus TaxID=259542 RepID=A0AAV4D486_9GAST|nr:hypothetical protein PoB_006548200 [Plakobranchus ocellatus]
MVSELAPIICRDFSVVCSCLAPTCALDKGLEVWDHLVVSGYFALTTSTSSLSRSVDHRKQPLSSTSRHHATPGHYQMSLHAMTSRAWQLKFHAYDLLAWMGSHQIFSTMWR